MNNQHSNPPTAPIFILCCDRSGSSLLRYIVDTHPDIASPAELNLGQLCQNLYKVSVLTTGEVTAIADQAEKNRLLVAEVRRIVSGLMENYATARNKLMWCEKSPQNLLFLDIIKKVFPEAKYICLHRHAMDVVHSCLKASQFSFMPDQLNALCRNSGSIVGAMAENWIEKTRTLLQFERENSQQCFRIKYESYVSNPTQALEPMFAFLGVHWDASLLDSVFSVHHDLGPEDPKVALSKGIHHKAIGKGAQINLQYIPQNRLEEMKGLLTELDYPSVEDWGTKASLYQLTDVGGEQQDRVILSVGEIFSDRLPPRLNQLVDGLQGRKVVYKIIVTGDGGGIWKIDLTKPSNQIVTGNGHADCTITFSSKDILDIVNGNLNPIEIWNEGKLHITGEIALAEIFCWFLVGRLQWHKSSAGWWWKDLSC